MSTHWWFNLDPRVSARQTYWQAEPGLRFDCEALGSLVSDLVGGWGELSLDTIGYGNIILNKAIEVKLSEFIILTIPNRQACK